MQARSVSNNNNDSGFDFDQFTKQINEKYKEVLRCIGEIGLVDKLATSDSSAHLKEVLKLLNKRLFKDEYLKVNANNIIMRGILLKVYDIFKQELNFRSQFYRQINVILKSNQIEDTKLLEIGLCIMMGQLHLHNTQRLIGSCFVNIIFNNPSYSTHFNTDEFNWPELVEKLPATYRYMKGFIVGIHGASPGDDQIRLHVNWGKCRSMIFSILDKRDALNFAPEDSSHFASAGRKFIQEFSQTILLLDPKEKGEWLTFDNIHATVMKFYKVYPMLVSFLSYVVKRESFAEDYYKCREKIIARIIELKAAGIAVVEEGKVPEQILVSFFSYFKKFIDDINLFWLPQCTESLFFTPNNYQHLKDRYLKDLDVMYTMKNFLDYHQKQQQLLQDKEEASRREQENAMLEKLKMETESFLLERKMKTTLYKNKVMEVRAQNAHAKKVVPESQPNEGKFEIKNEFYINESVMLRLQNLNNHNKNTLICLVTNSGSVKMKEVQSLFEALHKKASSGGSSHFTIELDKLIVVVPQGEDPNELSISAKQAKGGMFFPHGASHTPDLPRADRLLIKEALSKAGITAEILVKIGLIEKECIDDRAQSKKC